MSMAQFLTVYVLIAASMLACRLLPFFLLRGRQLPDRAQEAIELIPVAAFTALVANDILEPSLYTEDPRTPCPHAGSCCWGVLSDIL